MTAPVTHSHWRPARLDDLEDTGTVLIFAGAEAWQAAERFELFSTNADLLEHSGEDPLAALDGGFTTRPLVVTRDTLADPRKLARCRLANRNTSVVNIEIHGHLATEEKVRLVELITSQAAAGARFYVDGTRDLVADITAQQRSQRAGISAAELKEMADSERAELLLARYGGALALDDASDTIHQHNGMAWQALSDKALRRELASLFREHEATYSARKIGATVDTLKLALPLMDKAPRHLIGFQNGVFDMATRTFRPHRREDWLLNVLAVDYGEPLEGESLAAHAPNFSHWLNRVARGTLKADRILAALFMVAANRYDWQLFLEITGPGGSGKSIFAEICTMLAGASNTTAAGIDAIEKPRERAALVGYSLIILPDQPRWQGDGAGLKAITGGDAVEIDPKHKPPYSTRIPAVILAVNNDAMSFSDRSGGISRRRVIFSFGEPVPEQERDIGLKAKITAELPVIMRHLLARFSEPEEAKRLLQEQQKSAEALEVKRHTDSLVDFCSYLRALEEANGLLVGNANITPLAPRRYLYHAYLVFMSGKGHKHPLNVTAFGRALSWAMSEHGSQVLKQRTNKGVRTNLNLDDDSATDWLHGSGADDGPTPEQR